MGNGVYLSIDSLFIKHRVVRQTTSHDTVVYIMSNTIKENARCGRPLQIHHTMQHVAALKCVQSERTLLCKHSPHEGYKRRQRTMFLIHVSRSQWKEQRSSSRFKMATIVDTSPMEHICSQCGKSFVQKQSLLRHVRTQHGGVWRCVRCSSTFNREANYIYHTRV